MMSLEDLRQRFRRRDAEIDFLYQMYGREDEPLIGAVYAVGLSGTGKTSLILEFLKKFNLKHAYVDLVQQCSMRALLQTILKQFVPDTEHKCENLMEFVEQLPSVLNGKQAVIILDHTERLRDMEANLLPALIRLRELTCLDLSVILISTLEFTKLTQKLHVSTPLMLRFRQYSKDDVLEILASVSFSSSDNLSEDFRHGYLSVLLSVFYRCCRDLPELRHQARRHYGLYSAPVLDGTISERDSLRLYQRIAPQLRNALETVYMRGAVSTNINTDILLPFYAKYLLIAAYLASYNPAREDKRLFMKEHDRRRKTLAYTKRSAKVSELLNTQLGPKQFTLDRLLAIFFSVVNERAGLCSNLMSQISSLVHMQLLTAVGEHNLDGQRYKCNVNFEYIHSVSKTVGFNIRKYLFDFI